MAVEPQTLEAQAAGLNNKERGKEKTHTESDVKLQLKSGFGFSNIAVIRC